MTNNEVTRRDYFAGMALQGLLAGMDSKGVLLDKAVISHLVYSSYQFADELIKQGTPQSADASRAAALLGG